MASESTCLLSIQVVKTANVNQILSSEGVRAAARHFSVTSACLDNITVLYVLHTTPAHRAQAVTSFIRQPPPSSSSSLSSWTFHGTNQFVCKWHKYETRGSRARTGPFLSSK